jgi:putative transcriptional regulator
MSDTPEDSGAGVEPSDLTGRLLVATPALGDPNFRRAVVLLVAHGDDGAIGVVLNRPGNIPVEEAVPGWDGVSSQPALLFGGGPVSGDTVICIARARTGHNPSGFAPFFGPLGTLSLEQDPEEASADIEAVRLFVGYAGWGPGQMEAEIEEGAWYVLDSLPSDAFVTSPSQLWATVLRRQGGTMAMVSTFPEDPSLN